jgi:hypothetical protein
MQAKALKAIAQPSKEPWAEKSDLYKASARTLHQPGVACNAHVMETSLTTVAPARLAVTPQPSRPHW